MSKLSADEQIETLRLVMNFLKSLVEDDAVSGVILSHRAYDGVLERLRLHAKPYDSGIRVDPEMSNMFVVDGVLFLRGTQ